MDRRLRTSRSAADRWAPWRSTIGGHRGDRRSASARERPRGAEGGSGWGVSGGMRDTRWLKGWSARHGVAVGGSGG